MPEFPDCQPWCQGHDDNDPDCQMKRTLFHPEYAPSTRERDAKAPSDPALEALRESFGSLGGFPPAIDIIQLYAYQAEDSDQTVVIDLAFWQSDESVDEQTCSLSTNLEGLEEMHKRIGEVIQTLRK